MRNSLKFIVLLLVALPLQLAAEHIITGEAASKAVPGARKIRMTEKSSIPNYIEFAPAARPKMDNFESWAPAMLGLSQDDGFSLISSEPDKIGMVHYRYRQTYKGHPVEGGMWLVHTRNGEVISMNGDYFSSVQSPCVPVLSESDALFQALVHVGASVYKWQLPEEEEWLKWEMNDPAATYMPNGEFTLTPKNGSFSAPEFVFSYRFNIYAQAPLSRRYVYVDANTGDIIWEQNLIHHVDSAGTANTGYSGQRPIVSDWTGSTFRLRETGRGLGIQTFDMNEGTSYGAAVDFTDSDNYWNNTANLDRYAGDAHWGAEMTYDYYWNEQGRNSINGSGFTLRSYVHYDNNYSNAFWDGQRMTYGDGNNRPFTAIDIAGHEITHGLTTFTANLVYQDEPGALNESFSDIFGNVIEEYGRPFNFNWRIGEDLYSNGIRNMQNPNALGDPDTYFGTNWYTGTGDNGGVHTNSGVQNKWFYILSQGESGTNDIGDSYNVSGLGIDVAGDIAFRNLTVYLTNSSQYADARFYAIQSADDLYGTCSNEVTQTTNAWYAVGVGGPYLPNGVADFEAPSPSTCTGTVYFNDLSSSSTVSWNWDFGDGNTDTTQNPVHTYAANGTYTVTLTISDCIGMDTIVKSSYITVNRPTGPTAPSVGRCGPGTVTLAASGSGTLNWYDAPVGGTLLATGTAYTTPNISSTTTYYVESEVASAPSFVGPVNNSSVGGGGYHNNTSTQYLIFDVLAPVTLKSAWVNAAASGNRTITLWDGSGNQVWDTTMFISSGTGRITLNHDLAPGSYRIGGTQMNLYRNNSGPNYPYTLAGKVNITGSSAGNSYYYYLYDWEITSDPCLSVRTPVDAEVNYASAGVTPSGPTTICSGASVTLTADPNATYSWSNGASGQSITVNATGNYTVTVTSSNGCTATSIPVAVNVTNSPVPTVSVSGSSSICPGDTAFLTASTGASYVWSTGATTPTIPVTAAGSYTVTVTYPGGCSGSSAATNVTIATPPTAGISPSLGASFCDNVTNVLTASGGNSYVWSTGTTGTSINVTNAGTYMVTVTDINGCTDVESVTLSTIPAPSAMISTASTDICDGDIATLVAGGGSTYAWSTGATTASIDVSTTGTYTVTVTAANGCSDDANETITVNPNPTADFTFTPNLMTVSFSNTSTGTSGFCSYSWSFGDGVTSGSQFPSHTYGTPGMYNVQLVVDCNGCTDTIVKTVTVVETGVEEVLNEGLVNIYPNPFSGQLTIEIPMATASELEISLVDVLGRNLVPVYSGHTAAGLFSKKWQVPSNLAEGMYTVIIRNGAQIIHKKLLLQR